MRSSYEEMTSLQDTINDWENKYNLLQQEHIELKRVCEEKDKRIEDLELEMYHVVEEAKQEQIETVNQLEKKNAVLNLKFIEHEKRVSLVLKSKEETENYLKNDLRDLQNLAETCEKDKKSAIESAMRLKAENNRLYEKIAHQEREFDSMKEEMQNELNDRVRKLKNEKLALEVQLEEVLNQLDVDKSSMIKYDDSFQNELSEIDDFRPSRMSTNRSYLLDSKKLESAYREISSLKESLESVTSQISSLSTYNRNLQLELEISQAEIRRLETDLILSKESWSSENNTLQSLVSELERLASHAKLECAELATQRDVLQKQLKDASRPKSKKKFKDLFKKKV
jgi:chromosome segregation ATPase